MIQRCPTRLLSDQPAEVDAFGSHERVARAITELVRTEDGGKTIALTGSWGSGKSTVVQLLNKLVVGQISSNESVGVFVFDAWAHQGDPLRRAFLERFVEFLIQQGWTRREIWQDDLERLSRRREETETTFEPRLTGPGQLVAIGTALIPIGAGLMAFEGVLKWIGLLLVSAPLMAVVGTWLYWRVWRSKFRTHHRSPHEDTSLATLFIQKTREVHQTRTVRTPDPTSIEFADVFSRVASEALGDPVRRLLVVVDNLDRLDPREALSVWATMRTFFETNLSRENPWISRFWLLVPFDPSALERLWGPRADDSEGLIAAFTAKTFQMTFRVALPVLSDWLAFLKTQLDTAFPGHAGKDELEVICRLYHLRRAPVDRPLTPRDIKLFVNQVGALHRQWGDEIPLPVQALYVLYAEQIENPSVDLVREDFIDPMLRGVLAGC